jgi:hypothetical protein
MRYLLLSVVLLIGCNGFDYSYDLEAYSLNVPAEGVYLTDSDGALWRGEYTGADEPGRQHCGATALMNMLWWFGIDINYPYAENILNIGDFDPGIELQAPCAAACLGEPICSISCYEVIRKQVKGTTIPDMIGALKRLAPEGYELYVTAEDPAAIDDIIHQVTIGNPVLVNTVSPNGKLHLAIVAGFDGDLNVYMANGYDRTIDYFMRSWSTVEFGGDVTRRAMSAFGLRPFVAMWYIKEDV